MRVVNAGAQTLAHYNLTSITSIEVKMYGQVSRRNRPVTRRGHNLATYESARASLSFVWPTVNISPKGFFRFSFITSVTKSGVQQNRIVSLPSDLPLVEVTGLNKPCWIYTIVLHVPGHSLCCGHILLAVTSTCGVRNHSFMDRLNGLIFITFILRLDIFWVDHFYKYPI